MTDTRQRETFLGNTGRVGGGWGWLVAYGVVSTLLGISALVGPFPATLAATMVIAFAFIVSGVFSLIAGIRGTGSDSRVYSILLGLLSLVAGGIMVVQPLTGAISLTVVVAAWLMVRGVMEIVFGVRVRRQRWLMIALGIVNILLAMLIVATVPMSALTLPGFILGISFLLGGITAIMAGIDHRSNASAFTFPG